MAGNERTKKAKLAHEKKGNNAPKAVGARFSPKMILETVEWLAGERGVIADLDGNGRLAIIPSRFSMTDRKTGKLVPAGLACPAVYDRVAGLEAVNRYKEYREANSPSDEASSA
jgi:hypothetical protein